jgi:protein-S-isoprenylcysteine O-methyltransferase Ste14
MPVLLATVTNPGASSDAERGGAVSAVPESPRLRPFYLACGVAGYLAAVVPMAAFVAFVAGLPLWTTVDGGALVPARRALAVDLALLVSFGAVHSLLARERVKRALAGVVPPELERSLYSIVAGGQIVLLLALWRPLPEPVWTIETPAARAALWALYAASWGAVAATLGLARGARLFGLARTWAAARRRAEPEPPIADRGPYAIVRHPLYAATIVALFAAPEMSRGRLLLAGVLTAYILVGMRLEERDLEARHGEAWRRYKARVPALVPRLLPSRPAARRGSGGAGARRIVRPRRLTDPRAAP